MHISPSDTLCGLPVLELRRLLRRSQDQVFSSDLVAQALNRDIRRARELCWRLHEEGLIDRVDPEVVRFRAIRWRNTASGDQLAQASAASQLRRETANRRLGELLARAEQVNREDNLCYRIERIRVFGSYLSRRPRISDVDLVVDLAPRWKTIHQSEQMREACLMEASRHGRRFDSVFEELAWPEMEIRHYLKATSRVLSLHDPLRFASYGEIPAIEIFRDRGPLSEEGDRVVKRALRASRGYYAPPFRAR